MKNETIFLQRRAHKEALENQSASASNMDTTENSTAVAGQGADDLVVDSLAADAAPDDQPQQQLLYSLDQAILHSVERCCKLLILLCYFFLLTLIFFCQPLMK